MIRNVKYSDEDLGADHDSKEDPPMYGNVEASENMKEALRTNPKFMTYEKIDILDCETRYELGFTKARYGLLNKEKGEDENEVNNDVLDLENKSVDYAKQIATDLPTVTRYFAPPPGPILFESKIADIKEKFIEATVKFRKEECNEKGFPKSNLTKKKADGLKELKEKVRNGECVVTKTDKSGKLTIDSVENYEAAVRVHTTGDKIIDQQSVAKLESKLNDHLKVLNGIFNVGTGTGRKTNEERIKLASNSRNVPPPPMKGFRKDHKSVPAGNETVGPPVRPVVSANQAPNSRISHFVSKIINNFADAVENHHEVRSSEEMRAAFEKYNTETDADTKKQCKILSMDVSALFPSMSRKSCLVAVKEMILESDLEVKNFDWLEGAKYVAIMCSDEDIEEYGLSNVIPQREKVSKVALTV